MLRFLETSLYEYDYIILYMGLSACEVEYLSSCFAAHQGPTPNWAAASYNIAKDEEITRISRASFEKLIWPILQKVKQLVESTLLDGSWLHLVSWIFREHVNSICKCERLKVETNYFAPGTNSWFHCPVPAVWYKRNVPFAFPHGYRGVVMVLRLQSWSSCVELPVECLRHDRRQCWQDWNWWCIAGGWLCTCTKATPDADRVFWKGAAARCFKFMLWVTSKNAGRLSNGLPTLVSKIKKKQTRMHY